VKTRNLEIKDEHKPVFFIVHVWGRRRKMRGGTNVGGAVSAGVCTYRGNS